MVWAGKQGESNGGPAFLCARPPKPPPALCSLALLDPWLFPLPEEALRRPAAPRALARRPAPPPS